MFVLLCTIQTYVLEILFGVCRNIYIIANTVADTVHIHE